MSLRNHPDEAEAESGGEAIWTNHGDYHVIPIASGFLVMTGMLRIATSWSLS
ncbi:MAG: hypothetical protein HY662_01815 [Chloroflexi bacterium]|nr:hypothetical protein [Chloroflexota bacterium]